MGILKNGILGSTQNKTGAVIGRMHKGQNIVTGKYRISGKHSNPTEDQQEVRSKLTVLNAFLTSIQSLLEPGFTKRDKTLSALNAAFSYNYPHAFIDTEGGFEINYPEIVYSIGMVEPPESPVLTSENGTVIIQWYDMPQSKYCQYSDLGTVFMINPLTGSDVINRGLCTRGDLEVVLDVSPAVGEELHCFMNFDAADGKTQGKNVYLGKIEVA